MAEVVNEMPAQKGRKTGYPWQTWFDGRVWKLTSGVDFITSAASFRTSGYEYAKRHGFTVKMVNDGDDVYIQAIKEPADAQ